MSHSGHHRPQQISIRLNIANNNQHDRRIETTNRRFFDSISMLEILKKNAHFLLTQAAYLFCLQWLLFSILVIWFMAISLMDDWWFALFWSVLVDAMWNSKMSSYSILVRRATLVETSRFKILYINLQRRNVHRALLIISTSSGLRAAAYIHRGYFARVQSGLLFVLSTYSCSRLFAPTLLIVQYFLPYFW